MSRHDSASGSGDDDPPPRRYSPTQDYISEFIRVHNRMDNFPLRAHGVQYDEGISTRSAPAWTQASQHLQSEHDSLQQAIEASEDLRQRLTETESSIAAIRDNSNIDERLEEIEPLDDRDIHQKTVDMVTGFLQEAPNIIPDLQSIGFDVGAESRQTVQEVREFLDSLTSENVMLRDRQAQLSAQQLELDQKLDKLDFGLGEKKSYSQLEVKYDSLHKSFEESNAHLKDARETIVEHETRILEYKIKLEEAIAHQNRLIVASKQQSDARFTVEKERQVLQDQIIASHKATDSLTAANKTVTSELDRTRTELQDRAQELRDETLVKEDALTQLERSNNLLEVKSRELAHIQSEKEKTVEDLTKVRQLYSIQSDEVSSLKDDLQTSRSRHVKTNDELFNSRQSCKVANGNLHDAQIRIRSLEQELANLNSEKQTASDEFAAERSSLSNQLKEKEESLKISAIADAKGREAYNQLNELLQSNISAWTNERHSLQTKHDAVTKELQASSDRLATTSVKLDTVSSEVTRWRQLYDDKAQVLVHRERQVRSAETKFNEAVAKHAEVMQSHGDCDVVKAELDILTQDLDDCSTQISDYHRTVEHLALGKGQQIDHFQLTKSLRNAYRANSELHLESEPRSLVEIHGLTESLPSYKTLAAMSLTLLVQAHSTHRHSVAEIHRLAYAIGQADGTSRTQALAVLYEFIVRKHTAMSELPTTFASSILLLRSIETFSNWVSPRCELWQNMAKLTLADMPVGRSSPLVRTMLDLLRARFQGSHLSFKEAFSQETTMFEDRTLHDGHIFARETDAILLITPEDDVIFVRLREVDLEDYDPNEHIAQDVVGVPMVRLAFRNCPLRNNWTTSWLTVTQMLKTAPVLEDLLALTSVRHNGSEQLLDHDDLLTE